MYKPPPQDTLHPSSQQPDTPVLPFPCSEGEVEVMPVLELLVSTLVESDAVLQFGGVLLMGVRFQSVEMLGRGELFVDVIETFLVLIFECLSLLL
jgi:hypothetical protein